MTATDSAPLPPNNRIDAVSFDDASQAIVVTLRGEGAQRSVGNASVAALFGARIRHASESIVAPVGTGLDFGKIAVTAATGVPLGIRKKSAETKPVTGEELVYALAMRVDGVAELWYLLAASFNFRKALGPEATYSGETNLRLFVKRAAGFAPHAVQDAFFAAMLGGLPLPPPVESLLEFFKTAAAK